MKDGRYGASPSDTSEAGNSVPSEAEIAKFRDQLRFIAARRLGDWAAAEDVAQETIRRAIEAVRARKLRNAEALPGFLVQTAVHICQHRGLSAQREFRALSRFATSPRPEGQDPLSGLISDERAAQVRRAFGELAEEYQKVLALTYFDGVPTAEIASRLNLSPGNVRVRRHRALARLAEILGVTRGTDRGLKS